MKFPFEEKEKILGLKATEGRKILLFVKNYKKVGNDRIRARTEGNLGRKSEQECA